MKQSDQVPIIAGPTPFIAFVPELLGLTFHAPDSGHDLSAIELLFANHLTTLLRTVSQVADQIFELRVSIML